MPKGADNTTLVLEAARDLFLERGLAGASMDAVARAAGVSKATVYAYFRSKDELFVAVVEREGRAPTFALDDADPARPGPALHAFARDAADLLLAPSNLALQRIVASESARTPGIGRLYFENGPARLIEHLAGYLAQAMDAGSLRKERPSLAAGQFLAIIVADLQVRAAVGLPASRRGPRRAEVVAAGVDAFLRAYAPAPSVVSAR